MEQLTRFGRMAKTHWETHRPKMVAHLKKTGEYQEALVNAQTQAEQLTAREVSQRGNDLESARAMALEQFVLLPSEGELQTLPADRMPFSQPDTTTV